MHPSTQTPAIHPSIHQCIVSHVKNTICRRPPPPNRWNLFKKSKRSQSPIVRLSAFPPEQQQLPVLLVQFLTGPPQKRILPSSFPICRSQRWKVSGLPCGGNREEKAVTGRNQEEKPRKSKQSCNGSASGNRDLGDMHMKS